MTVPVISNQTPAPGAMGLGLRPSISFDLDAPLGIDETSVQVLINDTPAYDGASGGYQDHYVASIDWTTYNGGPGGFVFSPSSPNLNAYIVPYDVFLPQGATQTVRVLARENTTGDLLDVSWSFDTSSSTLLQASLTNLSNTPGYTQLLNGVQSIYDPLRFDLTVDPIDGKVIDPTQVRLSGLFSGVLIAGGVFQSGYAGTVTPIPAGYRYEVIADPAPWNTGFLDNMTFQYTGDGGFIEGFNFEAYEPMTANPGIGGTVFPDFESTELEPGYADLSSGLGPPVYDTIEVQRNADDFLTIYGAGVWAAGWHGTFTPVNPGPILDGIFGVNQSQRVEPVPPVGFAHNGDTMQFRVNGHVVSPTSGTSFPTLSTNWNWVVTGGAPPSVHGKKRAVEVQDPTTLIVHTTVDGSPADCDFNLVLSKIRQANEA
jgi:hypothetical protein